MSKFEKMKIAGEKVSQLHNKLIEIFSKNENSFLHQSSLFLHDFVEKHMQELSLISGSKNYKGFPQSLCISINNKVCHGIASSKEIIQKGDIISIDIAASFNGFFGDSCFTYKMGAVKPSDQKLITAAYESMWSAIYLIKNNVKISDLGRKMEGVAKDFSLYTVREFCGHGIGEKMHDCPDVPFYYDENTTDILKTGDFITIEPMVKSTPKGLKIADDNWTAMTRDGSRSAQFEHTIAVLENGFFVTTFNDFDRLHKKLQSNIQILN